MTKHRLLSLVMFSHVLALALLATLIRFGFPLMLCIVAMFLMLSVVWYYFRRKLRRAFESLSASAKAFAEGDHSQRIPSLKLQELDCLGRDINQMLDVVDGAIGHLAVHREELRLVLSSIEDALWSQNYEGDLEWVNEPFCTLFPAYDEQRKQKYWEVIRDPELLVKIKTTAGQVPEANSEIQMAGHSYILAISRNDSALRIVFILHSIDAIQQTAQMKKDFIANLAHELRTPLTAIKGFTEAMLVQPENDHARHLKIIHNHTLRLIHLIRDLEQLIRLESLSGLQTQDICLETFFDNIRLILEPDLAEKNLSLRIELDPQAPRLVCDPFRFEQVFINLIQNSLRYTKDGGITIRVKALDNAVRFEVADTGRGIEERHWPRIFERFYVADPSRNKNRSGTGLGLAIVKHIVQLHHGTISVSSILGQGAIFQFVIPLRPLKTEASDAANT